MYKNYFYKTSQKYSSCDTVPLNDFFCKYPLICMYKLCCLNDLAPFPKDLPGNQTTISGDFQDCRGNRKRKW
jgi:hypothetical protein